jgi:Ca2+-binding RTX toxin-like protein
MADPEGVIKWRAFGTSGSWVPCVGLGKLATLATTTLIDVRLTPDPNPDDTNYWLQELFINLGSIPATVGGGAPSGLEHETIVVSSDRVNVYVYASDFSSRIVAGFGGVDLDDDGSMNLSIHSALLPTAGADLLRVHGGPAPDVLDLSKSNALRNDAVGFGGGDWIFGSFGDDELSGAEGNDFVDGLGGSDQIWGGDGDDSLLGGDGDDTIDGNAGADQIWAGSGLDTCSSDGADNVIAECEALP